MDLFRDGDVPSALAPVFISRHADVPCRKWSWNNQLLTALAGTDDARGFRQWKEIDRHVRKGERSFSILIPIMAKRAGTDAQTGEPTERMALVGFKAAAVFGIDQTDGEPLPGDDRSKSFIEALPLVDVARSWGLSVQTMNGSARKPLGWYRHGSAIALGVENLSTWTHELVHAADYRLGNLTENGQHWRSETVAELGGAILLDCMGLERDADRGGCWQYVSSYAKHEKIEPIAACQRVLKRTCDAVQLILTEYETLQAAPAESEVAA